MPDDAKDAFKRAWSDRAAHMEEMPGFCGFDLKEGGSDTITVTSNWASIPEWEAFNLSKEARRQHLPSVCSSGCYVTRCAQRLCKPLCTTLACRARPRALSCYAADAHCNRLVACCDSLACCNATCTPAVGVTPVFPCASMSPVQSSTTMTCHDRARTSPLLAVQGIWQLVPKPGEGFPEDFVPFHDMNTFVQAKYPKKAK